MAPRANVRQMIEPVFVIRRITRAIYYGVGWGGAYGRHGHIAGQVAAAAVRRHAAPRA